MGYLLRLAVSIQNSFMILFLLELLMMIAAPIAHIALSVLFVNGRIKLSIIVITLICLVTGIVLPILASYIDIINLPSDVRCATGSVGFAYVGMSLTVMIIPISALIFYLVLWYKRRKLNSLPGNLNHES